MTGPGCNRKGAQAASAPKGFPLAGRAVYRPGNACGHPRGNPAEMTLTDETEQLKLELDQLREEHRTLDTEITSLSHSTDALTLRRLKKRKLMLKDRIALLEDRIYPDIIA